MTVKDNINQTATHLHIEWVSIDGKVIIATVVIKNQSGTIDFFSQANTERICGIG